MEDYTDSRPTIGYSTAPSDSDHVGLLSTEQVPSVHISSTGEEEHIIHDRRHSQDVTSIELQPLQSDLGHAESVQMSLGPDARAGSPKPSGASSLLRRLTHIRSPIKSMSLARRNQRGDYDELDDAEVDHVPVDLTSLAGMGYELTHIKAGPLDDSSASLQEQETSYERAQTLSVAGRSESHNIVRRSRSSRLGGGMVVGAQLRRDRSRAAAVQDPSEPQRGASTVQRARTIRKIGQNLAEERGMMVSVDEQVDISSYIGPQISPSQRASTQSFSEMGVPGTPEEQPQSYYFPKDTDTPNWRPFSMRSPYIVALAVVSLGLAIVQEWLYQHSDKLSKTPDKGGLLRFNKVADVSIIEFFAWKYFPTTITIAYAVVFSIMDFDIRRLEPYYQLSRPLGSRAAASLNLDHLTMFQYFVPLKALRLKQWTVFLSAVGNIIASTAAPAIQNPSLIFVSNPNCPNVGDKCPSGEFKYFVRVHPVWSRVLSGVLLLVAVITMVLWFLLRRKSGLLSDPKGIAGIASMATKSHILNDFQGLDVATRAQIHKRLQHRRFVLHRSSIWQGEWTPATEAMQDSQHRMESPHPPMLQLKYGLPFLGCMVFGLVAVPVIALTDARVIPNTVPWLPILLATLLKLAFTTFESDVRMIEPFYQLSRGNSLPQNSLTLDYQGTVYGWIVVKAGLNRHFLVSLVGLASVTLDVLTVTVSSFSINSNVFLIHVKDPNDISNQDETFISFWTSTILSLVILTFVLTVTSLVYWRRRHPFLPREPSTIAAVLAFIYASNMLDDFIDTERLTNKQMERRLKTIGKSYALGWFKGRDGRVHCAIDQEPIRSRYVHGTPYTLAQAPWEHEFAHV